MSLLHRGEAPVITTFTSLPVLYVISTRFKYFHPGLNILTGVGNKTNNYITYGELNKIINKITFHN